MDNFDVIILGGGPAGVGAALGAANMGAKVALFEKHSMLGGLGTNGLVNIFCNAHYDGRRLIIGGEFGKLRQRLMDRGSLYTTNDITAGEPYNPWILNEDLAHACERVGVKLFLNVSVTSASFDDPKSVIFTLADGNQVKGRRAIDASGDATLAFWAGVPFTFGRDTDHAVMPITHCFLAGDIDMTAAELGSPDAVMRDLNQGIQFFFIKEQPWVTDMIYEAKAAGQWDIPRDNGAIFSIPNKPEQVSVNLTRLFVTDPTDPAQLEIAEETSRRQIDQCIQFFRNYLPGFKDVRLLQVAKQIGVRESRQIVGLYRLVKGDVLSRRQFDDVICQCCYGVDDHTPGSQTWSMDYFNPGEHYDIPWRCLVPSTGPENLIVAGRPISGDHDAMASFRVQPTSMAIGEAAGITAAISAADNLPIRGVEVKTVQEYLLKNGGILD